MVNQAPPVGSRARPRLKFHALRGEYARIESVLYFTHFADRVGGFDDRLGGVSAGHNQVQPGGFFGAHNSAISSPGIQP